MITFGPKFGMSASTAALDPLPHMLGKALTTTLADINKRHEARIVK